MPMKSVALTLPAFDTGERPCVVGVGRDQRVRAGPAVDLAADRTAGQQIVNVSAPLPPVRFSTSLNDVAPSADPASSPLTDQAAAIGTDQRVAAACRR